jgi:hypothetical protein
MEIYSVRTIQKKRGRNYPAPFHTLKTAKINMLNDLLRLFVPNKPLGF